MRAEKITKRNKKHYKPRREGESLFSSEFTTERVLSLTGGWKITKKTGKVIYFPGILKNPIDRKAQNCGKPMK